MTRTLLTMTVFLLLGSATAQAATIGVSVQSDGRTSDALISFTAAPGEANDVFVAQTGGAWILRDSAAPLIVGDHCTALDAYSARCVVPAGAYLSSVRVVTGDGDDRVSGPLEPSPLRVEAGAGDDVVEAGGTVLGGAGRDRLTGGPMRDALIGGPDADELHGGAGDDDLAGDGTMYEPGDDRADDLLDGGEGRDSAS
jgi:hypothetical protein